MVAKQASLDNASAGAAGANDDDAAGANGDAEGTTAATSTSMAVTEDVDYTNPDVSFQKEDSTVAAEGVVVDNNAVAGSSSDPMQDSIIGASSSSSADKSQQRQHQYRQGGERRDESEDEEGDTKYTPQLQEAMAVSEEEQLVPSLDEAIMYLYANHSQSQPFLESDLPRENDLEARDLQYAISQSLKSVLAEGY